MTRHPLYAFALALSLCTPAFADTPEARDPDVARCATVIGKELASKGFAGRPVTRVTANRAQASIDRWEAPFSARNRRKVATLIRVPLEVGYRDGAPPTQALEGRCGYTSGRLLATGVVATE